MSNKIIGISLAAMLLFAVPVSAQGQGDLNCNGFMDVSDLVRFLNLLNVPCDFSIYSECVRENGDVDLDGRPMTVGDILIAPSVILPDYMCTIWRLPVNNYSRIDLVIV